MTHSTKHSPGTRQRLIDSLIVHEDRLGQVLALSWPGKWKLYWEALPIQQMCIHVYHICVQVVAKVIYLWLLDSCWGCLRRRWRITPRLMKLRGLSLGGRFCDPLLGAPPMQCLGRAATAASCECFCCCGPGPDSKSASRKVSLCFNRSWTPATSTHLVGISPPRSSHKGVKCWKTTCLTLVQSTEVRAPPSSRCFTSCIIWVFSGASFNVPTIHRRTLGMGRNPATPKSMFRFEV